ncbi:MAG TPA: DUF2911 domain-containing protein [Acidobacteriota bacterium]
MKKICILLLAILMFGSLAYAQELQLPRVSQKASVMQTIGLTDVTITYSRPGVKGRAIWGGLVPYDKVWRTGANEATTVAFNKDVTINGQKLAAGTYSLHTIPTKGQWTVIFNKQAEQWGSYEYDAKQDALKIQVTPQQGSNQEWLTFSFSEASATSGIVEIAWEKVRVSFKIETDTMNQAMAGIKTALAGDVKDWRVPYRAADFAVTSNLDKAEPMKWIDQSIALKETYWNLRLKASMLAAAGNTSEAVKVAEKAVAIGKENKDEPTEVEKTEKLIAEWKASQKK